MFWTKLRFVMLTISFGVLSQLLVGTAAAQDPKPSGAAWWQWALSIPTSVNPLADHTGADCMVGQSGSTWFLAGVQAGGNATRTCSVPQDRALFFPVINSMNFNSPGVCGQEGNLSVKDIQKADAAFIDGAKNLAVQLDGKPIHNLVRLRSEPFSVTLPEDNVFVALCMEQGLGGVPAGVYSPTVDDGIYVKIDRLQSGLHTLHIHSENPSQLFTLDVVYTLQVVPVSEK